MSENQIAWLAVMDAAEARCGAELAEEMRKVRAAFSELIAADRNYDDAGFGLAQAKYNGEPLAPWVNDCAQADIRRAKALACVSSS